MAKEKKKSVETNGLFNELKNAINKAVDDDIVVLMEDGSPSDVKIFIPTGSTLLDYIISNQPNGGVPVGKITEISGLEASGKTLVAMQICANAQKMGGFVIYMDTEHALNTDFANRVGLDTKNNFLYLNPGTLEDTFKALFAVFHKLDDSEKNGSGSYPFVCLVWDSIEATPPAADVAAENPDPTANIGLKARILSKNLKQILMSTGRQNVAQVFLNQLRNNIKAQPFSDPYITSGGKALNYYASVRIRLSQIGKIKVGDDVVGVQTTAFMQKTRFGPPFRRCQFPIYFTRGINDDEALMEFLLKKDLLKSKNMGSKGKVLWLPNQTEDDGLNKQDFRKAMKSDPILKQKVDELVAQGMTVNLVDDIDLIVDEKDQEGIES